MWKNFKKNVLTIHILSVNVGLLNTGLIKCFCSVRYLLKYLRKCRGSDRRIATHGEQEERAKIEWMLWPVCQKQRASAALFSIGAIDVLLIQKRRCSENPMIAFMWKAKEPAYDGSISVARGWNLPASRPLDARCALWRC